MFPVTDVSRLFFGHSAHAEGNRVFADYERDIRIESSVLPDGTVTTCVPGTAIFEEQDSLLNLSPNREIKRQLYRVLTKVTEKQFPWGSLTGIRPTQIARELRDTETMIRYYDVRRDKAFLAIQTAEAEDRILNTTNRDDLFVYIGIPFCPGRCAYCSFTTQENRSGNVPLNDYLDHVLHEIKILSPLFRNVRAVYIGGGTPTMMDEERLESFIGSCLQMICPDRSTEITVEAGRPDTLTGKKSEILASLGVKRTCVNPQSLSDATLTRIGRNHSSGQFLDAFRSVREAGIRNINTDVIAGLPGESEAEFRHTVDSILELSPENITIHALCKKRTADISRETVLDGIERVRSADAMVSYALSRLESSGYFPYYLYKQKDTIGGLENTGFSKKGSECLYNVAMMSDSRNVLAFGAGGVSKRLLSDQRLVRYDRVRNPGEYIRRIEEIIEGKRRFFEV